MINPYSLFLILSLAGPAHVVIGGGSRVFDVPQMGQVELKKDVFMRVGRQTYENRSNFLWAILSSSGLPKSGMQSRKTTMEGFLFIKLVFPLLSANI